MIALVAVVEGSAEWQRVFFGGAAILLLWHMIRGWSLGPARQIVHLAALVVAYIAALLLGPPLTPLLRTVIQLPDLILRAIAGAGAGLVVYLVLLGFGALVLKRTEQQPGRFLRVVYGLSGSLLGIVSGCFLLWILVMGVRLIGTVAEARLETAPVVAVDSGAAPSAGPVPGGVAGGGATPPNAPAEGEQGSEPAGPPPVLLEIAAKARRSIEMGAAEPVIAAVDVIPDEVYAMLGDLARVVSTPETAQRFLEYPGAAELANHPKIRALEGDPDITFLIGQRSYLALLRNEKIIDAANDPELAAGLRTFELRKAMDHALAAPAAPASAGAAAAPPRAGQRPATGRPVPPSAGAGLRPAAPRSSPSPTPQSVPRHTR